MNFLAVTGFDRRVRRYHSGLFWVHGQRVIASVVPAELREDRRPEKDLFRLADFTSRLRFPTRKLTGLRRPYAVRTRVERTADA